jgi:enoyl-CoA hydratase/carnithine racemase
MVDSIRFNIEGPVAELTLCAPERRNAIGSMEIAAVKAALSSINASCRLFVIRSEGPVFCAGANLKEITDGTMSGDDFQSMTNAIAELPIPTLAIVEADVFGGGAELLFSCDFRMAVEGKKLMIPAAAVGLCYPVEGIERMTQRLGSTLVRRLLLTTEPVSFDTLSQHGAIDWLADEGSVEAQSATLIEKLARLAPMSLAAMLRIIKMVETNTFDKEVAQALADECSVSEDLQEGLRAQREKRAPVFNRR